jgi:hypothetical protein
LRARRARLAPPRDPTSSQAPTDPENRLTRLSRRRSKRRGRTSTHGAVEGIFSRPKVVLRRRRSPADASLRAIRTPLRSANGTRAAPGSVSARATHARVSVPRARPPRERRSGEISTCFAVHRSRRFSRLTRIRPDRQPDPNFRERRIGGSSNPGFSVFRVPPREPRMIGATRGPSHASPNRGRTGASGRRDVLFARVD